MTAVLARPRLTRLALPLLVALALLLTGGPARALAQNATPEATPTAGALPAAVAWLVARQSEDGGFPGFDGASDPGTTCDAIIALAAAQAGGIDVAAPLAAAFAYLEANALVYSQVGAGQSAKVVLAALAAGADPRNVGGVDPLSLVTASADATTGQMGSGAFDHALALLALAGAGEAVPETAIAYLRQTQIADGSWAFDGSTAADAGDGNTTALVLQALVAVGISDETLLTPAIGYLATVQAETGGFGYQPGAPTVADANSTALAVQALIAVGLNPSAPDLLNAAGALAAFQNPSGAFRYNEVTPEDNLFATVQAIPALAGLPLPIVAPPGGDATPAA